MNSALASPPEELVGQFFASLPNDSTRAIDGLLSTNKSIKQDESQVQSLKAQVKNYPNIQGAYSFNELICKQSIGKHLESYTYLVGYENSPMLFDFLFYRVGDDWKIISLDTNNFNLKSFREDKRGCR